MSSILLIAFASISLGQQDFVKENFEKREVQIPMRDGTKLFTCIYIPKKATSPAPFLMQRTPYSCRPYGADVKGALGPELSFTQSEYIFVYQDIRGRYMSEGEFKWMNPFLPHKKGTETDEATDTYDTIDWLLKNVPNNNGRVGVYGTSYPGHYAAQALINPHPALKAASPQAPMDDNWMGDDMFHNGAFFLPHAMNFMSGFGVPRTGPTEQYGERAFTHDNPDGYQFFLNMGSVADGLTKYNMSKIPMWKTWLDHPNYDEYWKPQNVSQHLKKVGTVQVLVVGGWFDAEDLQGPLRIFKRINEYNKTNNTRLVMGPWYHGSWNGGPGNTLWDQTWAVNTGEVYRNEIQKPFFDHYLKGEGREPEIAKVTMFDTGSGEWVKSSVWPPTGTKPVRLSMKRDGVLLYKMNTREAGSSTMEWISDPNKPVPASASISVGMPREYLLEDQRFAMKRPDVVTFQTAPMSEPQRLLGPVKVHLNVSTSGTDSDFVVKVIDVFPNDLQTRSARPQGGPMAGYQMLVRGEPFRARFRNSWSKPEAMKPNQKTTISFEMPDICHTFKKGHRIMIQVQSSWFPVVDRNPQTFVPNIFYAKKEDFKIATQKIWVGGTEGSYIEVGNL